MIKVQLPLTDEVIQNLHAGDQVLLSGTIYTARDAAHKRLNALLDKNEPLPFDIKGQTIYYVGPTKTKPNHTFGSAGPTTASRMDVYTPRLLSLGLKATIGKGYRSQEVKDAIVKNKAVYFVAAGGAGALLGSCVKSSQMVAFSELDTEAILKLEVEDFPVFVGIDCQGNDIYDRRK